VVTCVKKGGSAQGKEEGTKNRKTLLQEIEDPNKWKDMPCSWIGKLNIGKTAILLKVNQGFNATPL
jgi:hypothetical protein